MTDISFSLAVCLFHLISGVTNVPVNSHRLPRACVIGAGYSGLATARYMKEYGVNFTVFEATKHIGGTWRFDPHVGLDEDGVPVFSSMYKNLRVNTPRETMEFADFPFPKGTPSYVTSTCFYKYMKNYAQTYSLTDNIKFQRLVTFVSWAGNHWNLTYTDTESMNIVTEACDYIIIATGITSKPKWPKFEGLHKFKGNVIHSHDYKDAETYRNRRVLLVGAGPSGLDLAVQLSNKTAKLVHSHHLHYNQPEFSKQYIKKPDIKSFKINGVTFQDGSFEEVDDIIFCTGYDFDHPFLDKSTGITATRSYILPLYQQMINIRYPSMIFVGIIKKTITRAYDAQAQYVASLVAGKFKIPCQEDMLKIWLDHVYSLKVEGKKLTEVNVLGPAMDEYFGNLTQEAGVIRVPPVYTKIRDFNAQIRLDDLLNYRNYDIEILDCYNYNRRHNPGRNEICPVLA